MKNMKLKDSRNEKLNGQKKWDEQTEKHRAKKASGFVVFVAAVNILVRITKKKRKIRRM